MVAESIVNGVAYWLTVPDDQLYKIIPDYRVPRAVDVSASSDGCPIHGTDIFAYGSYPWILDREHPYGVQCPIGGETYPSNDFGAYYQSGMTNNALLTGPYADNGWGWQNASGKKFWFVGYAVHWHYRRTWVPAALECAHAYALTGDRRYARKAIVVLDKIASTYPQMKYRTQSRDGLLSGKPGKIINAFWESLFVRDLASAYDLVFETLTGPDPISLPWRTTTEIRNNIEANLLEEAMDAYDIFDVDGNYGTHQNALVHAAVVRDCQQATDRMIERVFRMTGPTPRYEGFDYALNNLVFKDGLPNETSPFYNGLWVSNFALISQIAPLAGINPFSYERMPRIFDAPLDLLCAGEFTPNEGDSGEISTRDKLPDTEAYEAAYRQLPRDNYAWTLKKRGALDDAAYNSFESLFRENIDAAAEADAIQYNPVRPSRILDGYGMAILNNATDSVAASLYYGIRGTHGHKDRLNIELFAHGTRISPDLGYPDFTNATTPGRFGWTANTISHNAVAVDGVPQDGNEHGNVLRFHRATDVQIVDVDAPTSYSNTTKYRRTLVMVEVGNDAYLVDVFRVAGGGNHVLSLHGAEGTFTLAGATLSSVHAQGTLAGSSTAYGADNGLTDGAPNYNAFASGFSFLYNWQNATPAGVVTGLWNHTDGSMLRVHVAPNAGQEIVVADARVSPLLRVPNIFKYLLARRTADAAGTAFVTVWELATAPIITGPVTVSADAALGEGADRIIVVNVPRGASTDTIAVAPQPGGDFTLEPGITSDAAVVVLGRQGATWGRAFAAGGSHLTGSQAISVPTTLSGPVTTVDYAAKTLVADVGTSTVDAATLVGKTVRIFNSKHQSVYTIASASRSETLLTIGLSGSDVFTGRIKIDGVLVGEKRITTPTSTPYPNSMAGMYLVTEDLARAERIESTNTYMNYILAPTANMAPFMAAANRDVWIADFGTGDSIEIEQFADSAN